MALATLIPLLIQALTEAPALFKDAQGLAQAIGFFHSSGVAPQPQASIDAMNLAVAASLSSQAAAQTAAGPKPA